MLTMVCLIYTRYAASVLQLTHNSKQAFHLHFSSNDALTSDDIT